MESSSNMKEGWDFIVKSQSSNVSAQMGDTYVNNVNNAVKELSDFMNAKMGTTQDIAQLKGFIAEYWHTGTFNIDSALKGSKSRAFLEGSNAHASIDVSTNLDKGYSMKYYASGRESAISQAKNVIQAYHEYVAKSRAGNPLSFEQYISKYGYNNDTNELLKSVYYGQGRIIPSDQLQDAIKYLENQILKESSKEGANRIALLESYKETLKQLSDRISDGEGVESIPLSKKEAEAIAALCKEGKFNPEDFGLDISEIIKAEYIMQQALRAGMTSTIITLVFQLGPEIYKALDYLIKNGEIDVKQLRTMGVKAISGSAEGFLRGSISASLTIACQAGKLGKSLVNVEPSVIGALTVLVIDTMKSSCMVACGRMTIGQMEYQLMKELLLSSTSLVAGAIGQALLPELPVLGYMLGSLIGSVIGSIGINIGEKVFLSFCADTGFRFFGIVDQNYELPEEVLNRLGIDMIDFRKIEYKKVEYKQVAFKTVGYNKPKYNTIEITVLRRGVIGINKIGYIM